MKKSFTLALFAMFLWQMTWAVGVVTYKDGATTIGSSSSVAQVSLPNFSDLSYVKAGYRLLGWSTSASKASTGDCDAGYVGDNYVVASDVILYAATEQITYEDMFRLADASNLLQAGDKILFTCQNGNGDGRGFILKSTSTGAVPKDQVSYGAVTFPQTFNAANMSSYNNDGQYHFYLPNGANAGRMTDRYGNTLYLSGGYLETITLYPSSYSLQAQYKNVRFTHLGNGNYKVFTYYNTGTYFSLWYVSNKWKLRNEDCSTYNSTGNQWSTGEVIASGMSKLPEVFTIYRYTRVYKYMVTLLPGEGSGTRQFIHGNSVQLPSLSPFTTPEGQVLGGWTDGVNTYSPGQVIQLTADVNLTAIYRPYRINYISSMGEVAKAYDLTSPAILPTVTMPSGYRFLGWATTNNASTPNAGFAGDEISFSQETTLYAVCEEISQCDKYVKANTREQNVDYIIAFEDGDGGPNAYALRIVNNSFKLEPLNLQNPSSNWIFRVQSNTLFKHVETGKDLAQTGGSYPSLSTTGAYTMSYNYNGANGGWTISFSGSLGSSTYYVVYSHPEGITKSTIGNTIDQWSVHKSLAQVRAEDKYPKNISLYKRTTGLAYIVKYVTYPGTFSIAQDEACYVYLPDASEMPEPYSTHFLGWATSADRAALRIVDYVGGYRLEPTGDVTLYAVYESLGAIQVADQFFNDFGNAVDAGNSMRLLENVTSNLLVEDGKNITLDANGKSIDGTITVKQGGVLNLTATTAANACYIEATSGKSGQIKNADLINSNNIYVDIQLESTKSKADGRKWYGFAVPFNVDPTSGITNLENTETTLTSGVDFYIAKYSGTQRAATRDGWQYPSIDMLVPGQFYMITIDGSCNVWRFKKANGATKFASSELALSAYPSALGIGEANWNAMGNPCLEYSNISSASTEYGYIYNNATSAYTAYRLADYSFVVGCPIFLQAEGGTMVLNHTGILSQLFAPERTTETRDGFKVMLSNASTTDNLYVTAATDAMPTYQTGKDVVKLGNALPMLWTEAYGMKLAAENAVLMDDRAEYDLHFYAPSAGIFTLSAERFMGDKQLDLYYAGQLVCTLSESPHTIDLQRGFNAGYRLVIHTPMGVSTDWHQATESFDSANKYIQDNQLYIRINGLIYNATGAIVK